MSGISHQSDRSHESKNGSEESKTQNETEVIETEVQRNLRKRNEELSTEWEVVEKKRSTLGADNVETISAMNHLAIKLHEMGQLHAAVLMQRQVLGKWQEILGEDNLATITAMSNLGIMLTDAGLLQEALPMQTVVLGKRRRLLGEDDFDTIVAMNNLATTLHKLGRLHEALSMQREVLDRRQRFLGEDDLNTISAMNNLASTLNDLGQHQEALKLQREVLAKRQELLREDDLQIIDAMENLANTLQYLDQLDQAVWIKGKVLESRKKVLGGEHPDTIRAMHNLASVMNRLGWHDEQLLIRKQALEKGRTVFGEEHPTTLLAISNLAATLYNMGRIDEVLALEKEVLEKRTRILGEDHPDTIASMQNLAITLHKLDRLDEAVSMKKETLEMRRRILGNHHLDTISTMTSLVTTFDKLGQYDQSVVLEEEVLEIRKRILGEDHTDTISAMYDLAVTLNRLNRLEEAVSMMMEALEKRKQVLGTDHLDTIKAMVGLINFLDMLKEYEQSAILEADVLEKRKRVLGDEHVDTIMAMNNLAITLEKLGRLKEALLLKQEVLNKRKRVLGPNHLDTIKAMVNLVSTFDELKQYEQSAILEADVLEKRIQILGKDHADTVSARKNLTITLKRLGRLDEAGAINGEVASKSDDSNKQIPLRTMNIRGSGQAIWKRLSSPENIRLVVVHAGTGDAALQGNIIEIALGEAEKKYIALSYAWGDATSTKSISCSGHSISITKNLYSALQRMRQPSKHMRFWCDALCIDQGDSPESLQERASQVQMMDRIFSGAVRVVVDLGDDDGSLTQVVEGVNAILRTPLTLRMQFTTQSDPLTFLGLPGFFHPMWPALRKFMLRPWFRRVWCVQEVVLAQDIRILFGNHSVTFEQLTVVVSVVSHIHSNESRRHQTQSWDVHGWTGVTIAAACFLETYRRRKARAEKKPMSLCDLVKSTMNHQSTDRRDRVYALYGIVDVKVAEDLPVDYSESYTQLSCRFSEYLIHHGHQVWALTHSGGIRPGRPSWTIDLETLDARHSADPLLANVLSTGQNASYSAGGKMEPQIHAFAGNACLGVRGVIFDQIFSRTGACPMPFEQILGVVEGSSSSMTPTWFLGFVTWIDSVVQWVRRSTMADEEAVWRTLVVDFNLHSDDPERKANGRALAGYGVYFERLLEWIESIKHADPPIDPKTIQGPELENILLPPKAVQYWLSLLSAVIHRCVARTNVGTLALAPNTCHPGDEIAIFQGVPLPFVLRKDGSNGEYLVVGICYVHGAMDGEIFQKGLDMQEILLR